jgi:polar amino acid transport system substrate-binding protein
MSRWSMSFAVLGAGLAVALPVLASAADVPEELSKRGELVVGVKCDAPPMGFLDEKGQPAGIDVDFGRYVARAAFGDPGKATFTCVTAASRVQMLMGRKVDVLFATMGVTDERKKAVDFTTSTNWDASGILVRAEDSYKSLNDLKGKTLLTNKGSWQSGYLEKNYPDIKLVKYDSVSDAIQALRQGRGDGVTQDDYLLAAAAEKDPRLKVSPIVFQVGWTAPAVRRGDTALRLFLNDLVTRAKTDGTFAASIKAHVPPGQQAEQIKNYTLPPPDGSSDQNTVLPPS